MRGPGAARCPRRAGPFPGLLGRGLIEVWSFGRACPGSMKPSPVYWAGASLKSGVDLVPVVDAVPPSPVYWAGASLKSSLYDRGVSMNQAFPGLLGRGLIEVGRGGLRRRRGRRAFPGLLGRGLIEVRPVALLTPIHSALPSPVYWAGASLKYRGQRAAAQRRLPFPGLLGRGLIEVSNRLRSICAAMFSLPRSTGPGPH